MKTLLTATICLILFLGIACGGGGPVDPDYQGPPRLSMYCPYEPPAYPIPGTYPPLPTFIDEPGTWWHYDRCIWCHNYDQHYALRLCRSWDKYRSEYDKWGIELMSWLKCAKNVNYDNLMYCPSEDIEPVFDIDPGPPHVWTEGVGNWWFYSYCDNCHESGSNVYPDFPETSLNIMCYSWKKYRSEYDKREIGLPERVNCPK